jgi:hypothetical protein
LIEPLGLFASMSCSAEYALPAEAMIESIRP